MSFAFVYLLIAIVVVLIIVLVLVGLVVWAVRSTRGSTGLDGNKARTAREILDQRYARGEITREQYQEMKQELDQK